MWTSFVETEAEAELQRKAAVEPQKLSLQLLWGCGRLGTRDRGGQHRSSDLGLKAWKPLLISIIIINPFNRHLALTL